MRDGEKVDISKIKPGDKVTLVPLEVKDVLHSIRLFQSADSEGTAVYFTTDLIVAHHPAPREFQVGDRVRISNIKGTVRGVDRDEVWVKWDEANYSPIKHVSELTLVEAGQ